MLLYIFGGDTIATASVVMVVHVDDSLLLLDPQQDTKAQAFLDAFSNAFKLGKLEEMPLRTSLLLLSLQPGRFHQHSSQNSPMVKVAQMG